MILHFKLPAAVLISACAVSFQVVASESNAAADLKMIADETQALNDQKNQVLQTYQVEAKACWQHFAVNDCLAKVRREKYQRLAPLEQLEIVLNAKRRAIKEAERLHRLNEKTALDSQTNNSSKVTP